MTDNVYWLLVLKIKGDYAELEALMQEMSQATKENEPGALYYEWSVDDAKETLHLYERYADADATMVHLGNFGKHFAGRFLALLQPQSFHVYGATNDALRGALSTMNAQFLTQVSGFSR